MKLFIYFFFQIPAHTGARGRDNLDQFRMALYSTHNIAFSIYTVTTGVVIHSRLTGSILEDVSTVLHSEVVETGTT